MVSKKCAENQRDESVADTVNPRFH